MAKKAELAAEVTTSVIGNADMVVNAVEMAATITIPLSQFLPLINVVSEIVMKVTDLYRSAQHNKNITKILMERISAAYTSVHILQAREELLTSAYYRSFQRLVKVLLNMKEYIEEITQYNKVQKILGAKTIEKKYEELCKDYDSSMVSLNLNLSVNFLNLDINKELEIVKEDVAELLKFQDALRESMNNVEKKVSHTNDQMNLVVERVSEMSITMQNMQSKMNSKEGNVSQIQDKIDKIFRTSFLPFEDYEEADEVERSDKLRKYVQMKTKEEFAFKIVEQEHINNVKNQVTILKKLKDCQNIINFYGLTDNGSTTFLVTEWAEKGNLRDYIIGRVKRGQNIDLALKIRIAYDIAKGLNFLNAVKMVHRDIRSKNIVITDHDIAKITNFKFSRGFEEATSNIKIDEECVRYSAPEMLRRGITGEKNEKKGCVKYDTKCEVYSFGILLWEIAECKIPYKDLGDFMEITRKVVGGYREKFTPDTDIPKKYQELVNKSVNSNPGTRPIFSRMLTDLQDIFRSLDETPITRSNSLNNDKPPLTPPVRKPTPPVRKDTIAAAEEDIGEIDWNSINNSWETFDFMPLEKAIEHHKAETKDKKTLYKCFDTYAKMDNPRAKYWKAYYISKGWSDLTCSNEEKQKLSAQLFKAAADYDNIADAQLRYATMVMQGKGVKQNKDEAINYFLKAAKNGHLVAMFNIATFYYSNGEDEMGNYYMINAANKDYKQAIDFCKKKNISY